MPASSAEGCPAHSYQRPQKRPREGFPRAGDPHAFPAWLLELSIAPHTQLNMWRGIPCAMPAVLPEPSAALPCLSGPLCSSIMPSGTSHADVSQLMTALLSMGMTQTLMIIAHGQQVCMSAVQHTVLTC